MIELFLFTIILIFAFIFLVYPLFTRQTKGRFVDLKRDELKAIFLLRDIYLIRLVYSKNIMSHMDKMDDDSIKSELYELLNFLVYYDCPLFPEDLKSTTLYQNYLEKSSRDH